MIDLDQLNLLVIFIIAFISYKGFQPDQYDADAQSDSQLSQQNDISHNPNQQQTNKDSKNLSSQQVPDQELRLQMRREQNEPAEEKIQILQPQGWDNIYPQIALDSLQKNTDPQKSNQTVQTMQNESENNGNEQGNDQNREKCDEQSFESFKHESEIKESSQFDSFDDSLDYSSESVKNPQAPQKLKKIRKMARKLKKDIRKQEELIQILSQRIQRQEKADI